MNAKVLGVDLRGLKAGRGAGVFYATKELYAALSSESEEYNVDIQPLYSKGEVAKCKQVFFPTGAVPLWFRGRAFPWVHDLLIFDYPEWFNQSLLKRLFTTQSFLYGLRRAVHVFAVSEFTKRDIERLAAVPSARITVTYEGVGWNMPETPMETKVVNPYFLVLGTLEPRKNLGMLFDLVRRGGLPDGYRLVVAGQRGWGNVSLLEHPQIEYVGVVNGEKKISLLRDATALLLPSLSEGFGRTALEAMSLKTVPVASRTGAIPEVVGKSGLLLDPGDPGAWEEAMRKLANDDDALRSELSGRAFQRAKEFSWKRTAEIILKQIERDL